ANNSQGQVVYRYDVSNILSSQCFSCHQSGSSGSGVFDLTNNVESDAAFNAVRAKVDLSDPANSLVLRKNNGTLSHSGGAQLPNDSNYDVILKWIEQGAKLE
ncbi:MAG: hypothetical protein R3E89_20085, partial [Thiolinea sp.]